MRTESATPHRTCPACRQDNAEEANLPISRDEWRLKACAGCGFIYLENAPDYTALEGDFAWEKTYVQEGEERKRTRSGLQQTLSAMFKKIKYTLRGGRGGEHLKVHRYIDRHFKAGHVLDVGCSRGRTLFRLDEKYIPFGIEISPALQKLSNEICSARGGHVVRNNAVAGMDEFEENFFEGIIMRAFLEHETQPAELLAKSIRTLKPGGCAIIKVPNYGSWNRRLNGRRWCGLRYPDHVNYFTPETLLGMVRAAGYQVERFRLLDHWPLSDNMWLVIKKP